MRSVGQVSPSAPVPFLGYSREILKDMDRAGLHLYRDGKREKAALRGANTESGRPK